MNKLSNILTYNLPDIQILESEKAYDFCVWQPDDTYIILGRANDAETAVFTEKAEKNNLKILKRPSGGESVILSPSMIVFSLKITLENLKNPHKIFEIINADLISSLTKLGIENLHSKGISDLSIGEKKILGSSIYRKQNTLFYHAVLNVKEDISIISSYLKHPKKEPDYRKGRNHDEFVTSIYREGYEIEFQLLKDTIFSTLKNLENEFKLFI